MGPWDAAVAGLATAGNQAWHDVVFPLAVMTKLAYTATHGSYYNASEVNATAPGWIRDLALTANPRGGGMRALYFYQPETQRGVIAFRGTDLNISGVSGQADRCGDMVLWDNATRKQLPGFCDQFSDATLDYWARAKDFVAAARAAHPDHQFLFTGHSLGAGLSCLSAGAAAVAPGGVMAPAVAFSAGSWVPVLRRLTGLDASRLRSHDRVYTLADRWDPVEGGAIQRGETAGQVCIYSYPPPASCFVCFADDPLVFSSLDCLDCFRKRHVYSHYLHDLVGPGRPLPQCTNASDARPPLTDEPQSLEPLAIVAVAAGSLLVVAALAALCLIAARRRMQRQRLLAKGGARSEAAEAEVASASTAPDETPD